MVGVCQLDVGGGDRAGFGGVPTLLAPFLQEIGVALGHFDDPGDRIRLDRAIFRLDRMDYRRAGRIIAQWANAGEQEQALGVGLGLAHLPGELRQACGDQGDRAIVLAGAVERGDQCREFAFGHVLQLVDEQHQRGAAFGGGGSGQVDQVDQVGFEIAIVGHAHFAQVERGLKLAVAQLERLDEPRQRTKPALGQGHRRLPAVELEQRGAQRRDQHGGERLALGCLDRNAEDALPFRRTAHGVEQHRLADAAQAEQDHALRVAAAADAVERDGGGFQHVLAPGQLRRTAACARCERVTAGIHARWFIQFYPIRIELCKSARRRSVRKPDAQAWHPSPFSESRNGLLELVRWLNL